MILEDKLITMRLQCTPEFILRMHELVEARTIAQRSALVLQIRPENSAQIAIDLQSQDLIELFRAGVKPENNWWNGFHSSVRPQRCFHGISGLPSRTDPTWATELHRDGHFIAAVWHYPELPNAEGVQVQAIADFYQPFFLQFFQHANVVLGAGGMSGSYSATATLLNAPHLHFAAKSWGANYALANSVPMRPDSAQWTILHGTLGTDDWKGLAQDQWIGLCGLYGQDQSGP